MGSNLNHFKWPDLPAEFWWAKGHQALNQNWPAGDFDTWIKGGQVHLEAFGVSFFRADIEKLIPAGSAEPASGGCETALPGSTPNRL